MESLNNRIGKYQYYFYLLLIFLLFIALVNPFGDFPLNDDWRYASIVKGLAETGTIDVKQTFAPNLLFQLGYGTLLVKLFGFSFDVLRFSTIAFFLVFAFLFFRYASSRIPNIRLAFFISLLVLANPFLFGLSFSFMTDVPFTVLVFISIVYFKKHFERRQQRDFILAVLFSLLSFLIRQPGIMLPILYVLMLAHQKRYTKKSITQLFSVSSVIVLFYFATKAFKQISGLDHMYVAVEGQLLNSLIESPASSIFEIAKKITKLCITLGLCLIPILPLHSFRSVKLYQHLLIWTFNIALLLLLISVGKVFPFGGNYINLYGFGPALLRDVYILEMENLPHISTNVSYLLNFAGQLSFSYLFLLYFREEFSTRKQIGFQHFIFLSILAYMGVISITSFFDRYMLVPFVLIVLYIIDKKVMLSFSGFRSGVSVVMLLPIMYFSVAGTHDYMSWHREKYALFLELKQEGITIEEMDAGHELNSWELAGMIRTSGEGKSWWHVVDDKYLFSFGPVEGYRQYKSRDYFSWLNFKSQKVHVLFRDD